MKVIIQSIIKELQENKIEIIKSIGVSIIVTILCLTYIIYVGAPMTQEKNTANKINNNYQ
jgi:hypothetical protein